ncbi:MAG: GNAT family N-acetyltransferase [Chloroflexota bacterium]|nr:GNAT family N-acetyltransferase [Chloroflexota bacterium]
MQPYTIRLLTAADWDAWWRLRLRALADHPDAFGSDIDETLSAGEQASRERFAPKYKDARNQIFGAFTGEGTLVGVAGIVGNDRRKTRHRVYIWGVYVAPEVRGANLGHRLVAACIDHARQIDGVLQIHLTVSSHNTVAVRLYERLGFTRYGREPRSLLLPDGTVVDEDLMVLLLDG